MLATHKDGKSHLNGYLDDYAALLDALLVLLQADFDEADLVWARELAEALLTWFEDREQGGFFFTAHDHPPLIHRPKPGHDNVFRGNFELDTALTQQFAQGLKLAQYAFNFAALVGRKPALRWLVEAGRCLRWSRGC